MVILVPQQLSVLHTSVPDFFADVEWSAATTYALGAEVKVSYSDPPDDVTQRYRSLVDGNLGNDPAASPGQWLPIGTANEWAMFDNHGGTQTVMAENPIAEWSAGGIYEQFELVKVTTTYSIIYQALISNSGYAPASSPSYWKQIWVTSEPVIGAHITCNLMTSNVDAVAYFGLEAHFAVVWPSYQLPSIGRILDDGRQDVICWVRDPEVVYPEIHEPTQAVGISIMGLGTEVRCGGLQACRKLIDIGQARLGADTGIVDFSRKITDGFGVTYLKQGAWAKDANLDVVVPTDQVNAVFRALVSVRGVPVVWYEPGGDFEPLLIYGFFREFRIVLAGDTNCLCRLALEGLT